VAAAAAATADASINPNPPSEDEIRRAILGLRCGKAAGPDGIPPEFYRVAVNELVSPIQKIMEMVWLENRTPKVWQLGVLIAVLKKGDSRKCSNYRGITLQQLIGKIMSIVILRLCLVLDKKCSDSQAGFRSGRSTADNIFPCGALSSDATVIAKIRSLRSWTTRQRSTAWIGTRCGYCSGWLVCRTT
jgi:hypothetical protein